MLKMNKILNRIMRNNLKIQRIIKTKRIKNKLSSKIIQKIKI
jgi:hypothetical protein